ncbi:DUF4389 domain-containing protein [bacterium]|nr:DUF4389 domain-containing protein [bacterium]
MRDLQFTFNRPEKISRGLLLLRLFFGVFYVGIPHGIALMFRGFAASCVLFVAFWAVLFTGQWPERMYSFVSGTYRWCMRVTAYLAFLTDEYPPFSGKE